MRASMTEEKIWIAGFVDGEGFIGLGFMKNSSRGSFYPRIEVNNTNRDIFELFMDIYGGSLNADKSLNDRSKSHYKTHYRWYCPVSELIRLLDDIKPYLRIKKNQAIFVEEYLTTKKASNYGKTSEELWQLRSAIYQEVKLLNRIGTLDNGPPDLVF